MKSSDGSDLDLKTVEGLSKAASQGQVDSDWIMGVRVLSRDAEQRKELRKHDDICKGVAEIFGTDATSAAAALANLVVDDDEDLHACSSLHEAIAKLFSVCADIGRVENSKDAESSGRTKSPQFEMVCIIALRNIAEQVSGAVAHSKVVTAAAQDVLGKWVHSGFAKACAMACCYASAASMRSNAVSAFDTFCESELLKASLLDLSQPYVLDVVSSALQMSGCENSDLQGQEEALKLLQRICVYAGEMQQKQTGNATAGMDVRTVRILCESGAVQHTAALLKVDTLRGVSAEALSEMAKVALSETGAPLEDEDFQERIELLEKNEVTNIVMETLSSITGPFGEAEIGIAQLVAALVMQIKAENPIFSVARNGLVGAVRTASQTLKPMVELLRSGSRSATPEQDARIRSEILPVARFRLFCLGALNTMSSSQENASALVSDESHVCLACVEVISVTFDFDIEATRFALNILRNLCLAEETRGHVLDAVESASDLGSHLARVALKSRDPNSAGLAAAILRLLASSREKNQLERVLSTEICDRLVLAEREKTLAFAYVEMGRMIAHAVVTCADTLQEEGLGRHLGVTSALAKVSFLLQSEQPVLHVEALEALSVCSTALLESLQKTVSLQVKHATTQVEEKLTFRERLEQLSQIDDEQRGKEKELAKTTLAKLP